MTGTLKTIGPTFVQHITDELTNNLMMTSVTASSPITPVSRRTGLRELITLTPMCNRLCASTWEVIPSLPVVVSRSRSVRRFLTISDPVLLPVKLPPDASVVTRLETTRTTPMLGTNLLSRFLKAISVCLMAAMASGILTLRCRVTRANVASTVVTLSLVKLIALNLPMTILRLVNNVGQLLGLVLVLVNCSNLLVSVGELRLVIVKTTLPNMEWAPVPS